MYKYLLVVLLLGLSVQSCSSEQMFKSDKKNQHVWVFAQFNVPEEQDKIDSFWYYGQIPRSLYEKLSSNKVQRGFIELKDVHYWGDGDELYEYEDSEETGTMIFRIEDIRRLRIVKSLPKPDDIESLEANTVSQISDTQ